MTAQQKIESQLSHLSPILEAIAKTNPHDAQARALSIDPSRSVALLAPAGSGKTTQLLYRFMACLTVVERPEQILAITFTNKAAGEIVERVTSALRQAAEGEEPEAEHEKPLYMLSKLALERDALLGWNLVMNPSRLRIMTFDAYCAQLAKKMPIMSGLGGGSTSADPSLIYRQAVLETLGSVNDDNIPDELRDALTAVLKFARNQFELLVPMFSDLLAKRDQWVSEILHIRPEQLSAALTDLVKQEGGAAIQVLEDAGFTRCWDIFSLASRVNPQFAWASYGNADLSEQGMAFARAAATALLKTDNALRTRVTAREGFPAKEELTKQMNEFLKSVDRHDGIDQALQTLSCLPDVDYPESSAEMVGHLTVILRYLLANLMLAFDNTASVDFPEVAQRAIQSFGNGEEVGDAMLDEDRVYHLLVDENQDTSPAQYQLLSRLVEEWEPGNDGRSVFMCGDKSQSIYLFRGATVHLFTDTVKAQHFGPKQLEVYHLRMNFRSAPAIVDWNNRVYGQLFDSSFQPSVPFRQDGGKVTVEAIAGGSESEAARVVQLVEDAFSEDANQSVAILIRSRSHLKYILPALKMAGISASGTDIDPIADSAPVGEVVSLIRALWHKADRTSWLALLRSAFVGLSWEDTLTIARGHNVIEASLKDENVLSMLTPEGYSRAKRLVDALEALKASSRSDELVWKARALWGSLGGMATVDQAELGDVRTVFGLLAKHTVEGDLVDPQAFFNAVDQLYATPKAGTVQVMTIHKSKGLEFDTVIIPALEKSSGRDDTPLFHWRTINNQFFMAPNLGGQDQESAESRLFNFVGRHVKRDQSEELDRVCYVATTRAKRNLHILACKDVEDVDAGSSTSLLGCLKKVLSDDWRQVEEANIQFDSVGGVPAKARLAPDHEVKLPENTFIPVSRNDSVPTESDLQEEVHEGEGDDFRAKIVGIVYHRFVEIIAQEGLENWNDERVQSKAQAIASLMRREGYPIREIPVGRDRIIELLQVTLNSEAGRWILGKHEQEGQEVQLTGYRNNRWVHRYLDRPFVDNGCYWITDWKTAECPEGMDVEAFVRNVVARYKAKMEEYRGVVIEAGITLPVRLGLYLPSVDRFAEIA
jgi:ATP-dependent exoDNAse (exonuclease V) beta subunit